MDKKDGERLAILETQVATLQEEKKAWQNLIRDAIARLFLYLGGLIVAGVFFGWHLPETVRKTLADWISK